MKIKRRSLYALILGFCILVLGLILPYIHFNLLAQNDVSVGIIGATEGLPYTFSLRAVYGGLPLILVSIGASIIVPALFSLIFSKTVNTHLSLSTSAVSLGLSAVGALGLSCVSVWLVSVSFDGPSRYPIRYGLSILLGIACLFAFIILIGLYIKLRKANKSVKGFVLDVLTSIVYLPFFFVVFIWLYEIIS